MRRVIPEIMPPTNKSEKKRMNMSIWEASPLIWKIVGAIFFLGVIIFMIFEGIDIYKHDNT